jgi:ABC transporter ATM
MGIQVPYLFKEVVDSLNTYVPTGAGDSLMTVAGAVLLGCKSMRLHPWSCTHTEATVVDGAARAGSFISQELRNAVFSSVSQKVIRTVARSTFSHLLTQDLSFHLSRQTGGLLRAIERGTK